MILAKVITEYGIISLNRPFTYIYEGNKSILPGIRVLINFHNKTIIGFVVNVYEDSRSKEEIEEAEGFDLNVIKENDLLDDRPLLNKELLSLAYDLSDYYLSPLISVFQTMLPPSLKPRSSALKAPRLHYIKYLVINKDDETGLTTKQLEIFRLIKNNHRVLKSDFKNSSVVKTLLDNKIIRIHLVKKSRLNLPDAKTENKKNLTLLQSNAVDGVLNDNRIVHLIDGVTGSGKTEIYLALAENYLSQGKSVLMLVPEISLTDVMIQYFIDRFKENVAVLHSGLSAGEKYDEYQKIVDGNVRIVIGARSAIFAPLDNIGVIIIDEEHSESYKQDNVPAYHARDIALRRANYHHAKVVLGSATPLLESEARAIKGVYNHIVLPERINKLQLPTTYIVDMRKKENLSRQSFILSKILIDKIQDRLTKNEQIILLINRRGFSSSVYCRECGEIIKCPNCAIPYTYHKSDNLLKCHHCGKVISYPSICPSCGGKYLFRVGFGTEKIADEINKIFPSARVVRLDSDVGKIKNNIFSTLEAFRKHNADILIGTQMIAKGHDFPNVTLVGVVLADIGLSIPSFRNAEKTFSLITQSIGRSGRSDLNGEAVIQTNLPNHYAIKFGASQDYKSFYAREMAERKTRQYPPYTYLISLLIKSKNENLLHDICAQIIADIAVLKIPNVTTLGPSTPYIRYQNNYYQNQILIKYKKGEDVYKYLKKLFISLRSQSNIKIFANVDPFDC